MTNVVNCPEAFLTVRGVSCRRRGSAPRVSGTSTLSNALLLPLKFCGTGGTTREIALPIEGDFRTLGLHFEHDSADRAANEICHLCAWLGNDHALIDLAREGAGHFASLCHFRIKEQPLFPQTRRTNSSLLAC